MFFKIGVKGLQHYVACNSNTDVFPWILRDLNCLMFVYTEKSSSVPWRYILMVISYFFHYLKPVIPYFFISRQEAAKYENEEE